MQTFKTGPSPQQLQAMDRDLEFYPSTTQSPQALSAKQIESFNRLGYLKGLPMFDADEIGEHRQYFDRLLADTMAAGGTSYAISTAHLKCGRVYDLMQDPRLVTCAQDILGPDIVCLASQFFCKMPHDPVAISWHQDASYWPLTPSKTVTIWLAIDDADTDNSCMRFIAGSHLHGHLEYRESTEADNNLFNQTALDVERYGECVDVELKAGEISMHTDLMLHSSEANASARRRCGLTLRYCAIDVRAFPGFGWAEEGVVISGEDPTGHWGNPPRPWRDLVIA
jgi:ectoine hydroxylase-related dioxygenase (phytanoyl-CoA dioxygenase family)